MKKKDKTRIIEDLTKELEKYIELIIKEYGKYIKQDDLNRLKSLKSYSDVIVIENTGTISCFVDSFKKNIHFPILADKLLSKAKFVPGFGINKNNKLYDRNSLVLNNNTFVDYIKHLFIKGATSEHFYRENLLHETMHFCGSGGAYPLEEGLTEYYTRKLAQKYDLITTGAGYPKEVKIAHELEKIFGEECMSLYLFDGRGSRSIQYIIDNYGIQAKLFLMNIEHAMQAEFEEKYYKKTKEFNGIMGPFKKIKAYETIDYSKVWKMIEDYKKQIEEQKENKEESKDEQKDEKELSKIGLRQKVIDVSSINNSYDNNKRRR